MNNNIRILTAFCLTIPFSVLAQLPEKQISFASESKPHDYYVKQAELWWKEIEKNKSSEDKWYNYYRACRNAQGTANWREDFINESPFLKSGPDIVELMKQFIPNSFTYYYVAYSQRGIDPSKGELLLKAYEMNPDFPGIHAEMVTYAESIFDFNLRKKVNNEWYKRNDYSPGLISYAYNVLMSLEPNSILLTQHDNDSYPVWMLQDTKGVRNDVLVINFDFLLLDSYREKVFNQLNIRRLDFQLTDNYLTNWKTVLNHLLTYYKNEYPLYFGMTVTPDLYKDFSGKMSVSGLAFKFQDDPETVIELNKHLYEDVFFLDYLKVQLLHDSNQSNASRQNQNYLRCFKIVFDYYKSNQINDKALIIKNLALKIANDSDNIALVDKTIAEFK